ncbi:MAG: DUF6440 family protein [Oscillospiraceae bacterium]|nr:DUF6440 family protein [Oscillospiraceae bacterium]
MNNLKRFHTVLSEGSAINSNNTVIVDTVTGVHYLWHREMNAGGLTPLLDKDGKPVTRL